MVEAAVLAPSVENLQPWRFAIDDGALIVFMDARRQLPSDVDAMLAWTSVGAAAENAVIAARQGGMEPTVSHLAPSSTDEDADLVPAVRIDLTQLGEPDALFPYLKTRCTMRRMESRPLPADDLTRLAGSIAAFENVQLDWVTEPSAIRQLGKLVGMGNRIRFEHKPFHAEFYESMRFTRREVNASRDGLDVKTLQLPPGVGSVLRMLREWPRMRVANLLGFSRSVARQAAKEVRSSGAVGILSVDAPSRTSFIDGGRAFERIWLSATAAGLGVHPTASLPVFVAHAQCIDGSGLPAKHRQMARTMSEQFRELLPHLADRAPQMAFRAGFAATPMVRSLRRSASDAILIHSSQGA
jgi:nitroreductase